MRKNFLLALLSVATLASNSQMVYGGNDNEGRDPVERYAAGVISKSFSGSECNISNKKFVSKTSFLSTGAAKESLVYSALKSLPWFSIASGAAIYGRQMCATFLESQVQASPYAYLAPAARLVVDYVPQLTTSAFWLSGTLDAIRYISWSLGGDNVRKNQLSMQGQYGAGMEETLKLAPRALDLFDGSFEDEYTNSKFISTIYTKDGNGIPTIYRCESSSAEDCTKFRENVTAGNWKAVAKYAVAKYMVK